MDKSDEAYVRDELSEADSVRNTTPPEPAEHDVEKDGRPEPSPQEQPAASNDDPNLVTWDGPDDPEHPKNWPDSTKWKYTYAVSLFVFISPVSSSMIAPATNNVAEALGLHGYFETYMCISIFVLAFAIGPVFFGPASELYGRVPLLQINLWYIAWNLGCGFAQNKSALLACRFLAGIGGSAPLALGGGAISDIWSAEQRGKAMGLYTMGPLLGPVVGPIAGGFISEYSTWRWVFWSTTIAAAMVQVVGFFWLKESHPTTLLRLRRDRLARETGNHSLHTGAKIEPLPAKLFQPIVTCCALYTAYVFGIIYLLVATFPKLWTGQYGESQGIGGLNYISIATGSFIGLLFNILFVDRIYRYLKAKNGGEGRPEYRMPAMAVGSVFITIGLFWYGWSVQAHLHWIMPNIGTLLFSAGTISCLQGMSTYIVDSYQTYAASAMAACTIIRSLAGFGFPLFSGYMLEDLGYGWSMSLLAFVSIALGWIAPFFFWFYGPKLRAMSQFASG